MKGVADLITLIQKTKHDLSMDRRGKILNARLNRKYRKLGSAEVPITDLLFSSDLKAACANFDTTSKMGLGLNQLNANKSQTVFPQNMSFAEKQLGLDIPRQSARTWTKTSHCGQGRAAYLGNGRIEQTWQQSQQ